MEPDAVELRVMGCLIEKQRTTPDAYPLSLNALRLACNQATNRDPVVDFGDDEIQDALHRLGARGWTRGSSGHASRTRKYRHLLDEALNVAPDELAVLGVLLLRGVQTAGEIKQRTARMHPFESLDAVEDTLIRLADRDLVLVLPLRPGQKEVRFAHLLAGEEDGTTPPAPAAADTAPAAAGAGPPPPVPPADVRAELAELRTQVAELRAAFEALRADLGA